MHNTGIIHYSALLLLVAVTSVDSTKCSRIIEGTTGPHSNANGIYHFFMTLFNRTEIVYTYMPNTRYSVVLKIDGTEQMRPKFTRFLISAEAENANETADVGTFDLQDDAVTKFKDNCANTVMETSKMQKEEVSVIWNSPVEGGGCILIRATVLDTPDTWYMDFNLVLTMCQDSKAEEDDQGPIQDRCCACDEAKYEVTFEGLWSRNTHPKDFPSKGWLIRFSDVIGASHTRDYGFWKYNGWASTGLKQVAELGTTRILESELKDQSKFIRTIIKARGISYPNVTGRTFAVFRVDREHHLMSLVSMIDPSPDWIVGVSALELCLANCSWIEHKQLNLYPYDVGTDSGITYLSPNSPTKPQERIRRITSTYPNDLRSPFYDPSGLDMKPLAKLYLNRQRLYEKTCNGSDDSSGDTDAMTKGCKVTPWDDWSACSVTCGRGYQLKQRRFYDEVTANANRCNTSLTDRRICYNRDNPYCTGSRGRHDSLLESGKCDLTNWGTWSSCSKTCGKGSTTRSRNFEHKKFRKQCKAVPNGPQLQETYYCENKPCDGEDMEEVRERFNQSNEDDKSEDYVNDETGEIIEPWLQNKKKCPPDRYTEWSLWSPCSATCGPGVIVRSRQLIPKNMWDKNDDDIGPEECKVEQETCEAKISSCNFTRKEAERICNQPLEVGDCNSNILRAYFDKQTGQCHLFSYTGCKGNGNNFPTEQDCIKICGNLQRELRANQSAIMKNLKVSLSSVLSYHIPVQEQRSTKTKRAQYEKENFKGFQTGSQIMESNENSKVNCEVSEWSEWSRCESCRGYSIRTRKIETPAKDGGKSCRKKFLHKKKCRKFPPCSLQGDGKGGRYHRDKNTGTERNIDCKVTPWSMWSKCSATCGEAVQTRVRSVMVKPHGPWAKLCPPLAELKNCDKINCPQ